MEPGGRRLAWLLQNALGMAPHGMPCLVPDVSHMLRQDAERPDLIKPPSGCRFHLRGKQAMPVCKERELQLQPVAEGTW
jgi:ABC-type dipeptide/oligopeptide/nickel transport system ATPase component